MQLMRPIQLTTTDDRIDDVVLSQIERDVRLAAERAGLRPDAQAECVAAATALAAHHPGATLTADVADHAFRLVVTVPAHDARAWPSNAVVEGCGAMMGELVRVVVAARPIYGPCLPGEDGAYDRIAEAEQDSTHNVANAQRLDELHARMTAAGPLAGHDDTARARARVAASELLGELFRHGLLQGRLRTADAPSCHDERVVEVEATARVPERDAVGAALDHLSPLTEVRRGFVARRIIRRNIPVATTTAPLDGTVIEAAGFGRIERSVGEAAADAGLTPQAQSECVSIALLLALSHPGGAVTTTVAGDRLRLVVTLPAVGAPDWANGSGVRACARVMRAVTPVVVVTYRLRVTGAAPDDERDGVYTIPNHQYLHGLLAPLAAAGPLSGGNDEALARARFSAVQLAHTLFAAGALDCRLRTSSTAGTASVEATAPVPDGSRLAALVRRLVDEPRRIDVHRGWRATHERTARHAFVR